MHLRQTKPRADSCLQTSQGKGDSPFLPKIAFLDEFPQKGKARVAQRGFIPFHPIAGIGEREGTGEHRNFAVTHGNQVADTFLCRGYAVNGYRIDCLNTLRHAIQTDHRDPGFQDAANVRTVATVGGDHQQDPSTRRDRRKEST